MRPAIRFRLFASSAAIAMLSSQCRAEATMYFKCIDANGAISMQQTACSSSSAQEVKRAWAHPPTAADRNRALGEVERIKEVERARQQQEEARAARARDAAETERLARMESERERKLDECLARKIAATNQQQRITRYQQSLPLDKKALRYAVPTPVDCSKYIKGTDAGPDEKVKPSKGRSELGVLR